jgi:hypothetical protein
MSMNHCSFSLVALLGLSGCATIVSKKDYPVMINNHPAPTCYSIYDNKQRLVATGVTPDQVTLPAKSAPFIPAKYQVAFAGEGGRGQVKQVRADLDPWIAGNIFLGGVIGLGVDGFTGAMYKLPKSIDASVPEDLAVTNSNLGRALADKQVGLKSTSNKLEGTTGPTVRTASAR